VTQFLTQVYSVENTTIDAATEDDIKVEVLGISRDGEVTISFNQPLVVPPFDDSTSSAR